ncbi:Sensory neuron membrane protein 1 [Eumeta japonica]|uniref:Sensory neuron membrane protein 1 n=1 Tax=Eumeta variegata TaxID=151549 RepID=A0A4C1VWB4_EUMVA|nr:Sensory neuron membrane protein 1 [Eumeta japonica]
MKLARHLKIGVGAAGVFFFGLLFGWFLFPTLIKSQLKKVNGNSFEEMSLSKKTDVRAMWAKVPFPIDFKIYIFNYTNPEEIQKGALPVVDEIGPYYFE